jgi:hypothetical protein
MTAREQQIGKFKWLIAAHGFRVRDFLLTAPSVRPPSLERTRRRLMRQLYSLGYSAHDLVDKVSAGTTGAASGTNEQAPEQEN